MKADSHGVDSPPCESDDDASDHVAQVEAETLDISPGSGVENNQLPQDDHQSSVFFRIPAPEPSPGFIAPDTPENGTDQVEEEGEGECSVCHAGEYSGCVLGEQPHGFGEDGNMRNDGCQKPGGIPEDDSDDVCGEQEVGTEDGYQRIHVVGCLARLVEDAHLAGETSQDESGG